jgi:hypothetical protein
LARAVKFEQALEDGSIRVVEKIFSIQKIEDVLDVRSSDDDAAQNCCFRFQGVRRRLQWKLRLTHGRTLRSAIELFAGHSADGSCD